VHPEDLELVREAMDDIRTTLGGIEHTEVQAERRVSRGGAVVRTPDGDVDARVETKLQRAREIVEAALSSSSAA
jgi:flagellar assembly protein FliH